MSEAIAAVAHSTAPSSSKAAIEVGQSLCDALGGRADWAIAFATSEHRPAAARLSGLLGEALDTPYVCGGSARGVIAGEREIEGGPALAVLGVRDPQLAVTPFLFASERVDAVAERLAERMRASVAGNDLLLVWPDPYHVRPDRLLHGVARQLDGVTIAGGASSAARPEERTFQFSGQRARGGTRWAALDRGRRARFRHHPGLSPARRCEADHARP